MFAWTQRFLLILCGLVVCIVIAEASIRISGYSSRDTLIQDPQTGLKILKPNEKFFIKKSCFENHFQSNSFGFRSPEYSVQKPNGVFRIAVIGDSFVEARQVPIKDTFWHLLEKRLNRRESGVRYEVMPFGIPGNGTSANLLLFKEYTEQFQPDIVINMFTPSNDLTDDLMFSQTKPRIDEKRNAVTKFIKRNVRKSALVMTLYDTYLNVRDRRAMPKYPQKLPFDYEIFLSDYSDDWKMLWSTEEKLFAEFNAIVHDASARFVLVSVTEGWRVHDELKQEFLSHYSSETQLDLERPEKELFKISDRIGVQYLSLLTIFQQNAEKENVLSIFDCDGHWNETGHLWTADAIHEFLITSKVLLE